MSSVKDTRDRYLAVCAAGSNDLYSPMILGVLNEQLGNKQDVPEMKLSLAGNTRNRDNEIKYSRRLDDADAHMLYQTLCNNIFITALDLSYNNLTDDGALHVAKLIEESATIKEISLMYNDFGKEGAIHIAKALQNNETVVSLKANGNKFGNYGGMAFAGILQVNTTLQVLELGDTDLATESLIALATVLSYNHTLRVLDVSKPILYSQQEETTVHFANMLKVNKGLKELNLANHGIRDFGVTRLSENLMENLTLTHLNLSCNQITRDGVKELSRCLKTDTPLEILNLGYNRIEDDGAQYLAEAVATLNTQLKSLLVPSNNISGRGLCAIAKSLEINSTLDRVYIWGNKLEESACIAFDSIISSGRLELENTDIQPYHVDGVCYLAQTSWK